jgi:integrase/recombinase XerD
MTDIYSVDGTRSRYQKDLESLDALDSDADADALYTWATSRTVALSTRRRQLHRAKLLSRRSVMVGGPPLTDMDSPADVTELLADFEAGTHPDVQDGGLAATTLRQFRVVARNFFIDGLGCDWADEIDVGSTTSGRVSRSDLLSADDCDALLDAPAHPRDRALVAFLLATAQRIAAALTIRVGDVDLDGEDGTVYLNDDALGLKGAAGPRPLTWATGAVGNWYAVHPRKDDPDAALFCALQSGGGGFAEDGSDHEYAKGDPISRVHASNRLKSLGDRAGVDPEKTNPHNFRHTAITQMVEDGTPEQYIKWLVGWDKDSSQLERYAHVIDDRMMAGFRDARGIETPDGFQNSSDGDEIGKRSPRACPRCNATLRASAEFCDSCGLGLTQSAAASRRDAHDDAVADLADPETTDEQRETVARLLNAIENNPDVAAAVADAMTGPDTAATATNKD